MKAKPMQDLQKMDSLTPEQRFEELSGVAAGVYKKALVATADDAYRLPLLDGGSGAMADYIGAPIMPYTMHWCMTEWLVARLGYLAQDENGSYLQLQPLGGEQNA